MPKTRESKIRANAKYDSTHCTGLYLKFNNGTDSDILEKLSSAPNRQGYIKSLIRQDIARTSFPVHISICDATKEMLQEEAGKRDMDVCQLAKLIISEWVINNSLK